MSLRKSVKPLGKAVDVWGARGFQINDITQDSDTKHVLEVLKDQSRLVYEMQQLCLAVEALVEWKGFEEALSSMSDEKLQSVYPCRFSRMKC
jgi:hypothetical protein